MLTATRHSPPKRPFLIVRRGTWRNLWRRRYFIVPAADNMADAINRPLREDFGFKDSDFFFAVPLDDRPWEIWKPGGVMAAAIRHYEPRR